MLYNKLFAQPPKSKLISKRVWNVLEGRIRLYPFSKIDYVIDDAIARDYKIT
jgi:hypothetical protein